MKPHSRTYFMLFISCTLIACLGLGLVFSVFSCSVLTPRYIWNLITVARIPTHITVDNLQPRYTEEQARIVMGNGSDYRALANTHPDTPWYAWREFFSEVVESGEIDLYRLDASGRRLMGEAMLRAVNRLEPVSTDNGLILAFRAYVDALAAVELDAVEKDDKPWEKPVTGNLMDSAAFTRAAALLSKAVRSERFTTEREAMATEARGILDAPETLDAFLVWHDFLGSRKLAAFWDSLPLKDLADLMIVGASHLAGVSHAEDTDSAAFRILCDLQTMGARIVLDAPVRKSLFAGFLMIEDVTSRGYELLRAANRTEESERLLVRGRALLWTWMVDGILPRHPIMVESSPEPLWNDPALLVEAKNHLRLRMEKLHAYPELRELGSLSGPERACGVLGNKRHGFAQDGRAGTGN